MKKQLVIFGLIFFLAGVPAAFADFIPNDSFYRNQWYFSRIETEKAWEKINSSPDITIAIIDSGVDLAHPDLRENIWLNNDEIPNNNIDDDRNGFVDDSKGWDFVNNEPNPNPQFSSGWTESGVSHGTIIAGIISARGNNEKGIAGVTWQSKLMSLKVLNDRGEGRLNDVVRAVDYAVNNGADIINLSFTSFGYSESLREALERAYQKGVIVVAAAGNEQFGGTGVNLDKKPIYPACYRGKNGEDLVLGVAATDALDQKTDFSGFGSKCVDLTAPGISFFSTIIKGGNLKNKNKEYDGYWSGTSMAAALVSGTISLVLQSNPELSSRQVLDIVLGTCDNITQLNPQYKNQLGYGRINANSAVSFASGLLFEYSNFIVTAPISTPLGQLPQKVKIFNEAGEMFKEFDPFPGYRGAIKVVNGEFDTQEGQELVFGASNNQIKIYSLDGKLKRQFFPYGKNYRGNFSLAAGNFSSSDLDNLIVASSDQNQPVRIFSASGKLIREFFPYGKNYKLGINLATSDFNSDGKLEIVTAPANGQESVKVFSEAGVLLKSFYPYNNLFKGGINVSSLNISGRSSKDRSDLAFIPATGMEGLVRIYDSKLFLKRQFLVFDRFQKKGGTISSADLDYDGLSEIIIGSPVGVNSQVKILDGSGKESLSFEPYSNAFKGGVSIGVIKIKN